MPKQKITKEIILEAAFDLVRSQGYRTVNARSVAKVANCSVQPIYSYYENMEQLMSELFEYCREYEINYVRQHLDPANYFKSAGRCHITFAVEEKNLFEFVFLSSYVKGRDLEEVYEQYGLAEVTASIETSLGLNGEEARRLYLGMMVYTHGIASMLATGAIRTDFTAIHENINWAYYAFLDKIRKEKA